MDDPFFRAKLAAVEVELKALEMTQMRVISNRRNDGKPDPDLVGAEDQGLGNPAGDDRAADGRGRPLRPALRGPGRARATSRRSASTGPARSRRPISTTRKVSIYGGSNEIQRSIIAKAILGL